MKECDYGETGMAALPAGVKRGYSYGKNTESKKFVGSVLYITIGITMPQISLCHSKYAYSVIVSTHSTNYSAPIIVI